MMTRYGIPTFVDVHDFVSHLARRMGKLKKGAYKTIFLVVSSLFDFLSSGGVPDVDAAARAVLKDWNTWGNRECPLVDDSFIALFCVV